MKLDFSQCTPPLNKCFASPSTFIISSTHYLNNHLKLNIVINTKLFNGFDIAAKILATRHLKSNEHRYAFIKDTLTINFESSDSDEKVNL